MGKTGAMRCNLRMFCVAVCGILLSSGERLSDDLRVNVSDVQDDDICESIHNLQCWGDDIRNIGAVHSHLQCCGACQETVGCNAWTWNWQHGGYCFLKTACTDQRTGSSAYHSGIRKASPKPPTPGPPPPPHPPPPPPHPPPVPPRPHGSAWYDGIKSIKVFGPGDDVSTTVNSIYNNMYTCQFCAKRYAVLLKRGNYGGLNIPVGYYTSVAGVGRSPADVEIHGFHVENDPRGYDTDNFWRSVEGVTTTRSSTIQWATSQGCALRRSVIRSSIILSGGGSHPYSSGGFIADLTVNGKLTCGSQQQFFFRNSKFGETRCNGGSPGNFVFVGCEGAPSQSDKHVNVGPSSTAGKPFLVEQDGSWSISVPSRLDSTGHGSRGGDSNISMADVFVAKEGDSSAVINAGIQGKAGLLLTPGLYDLAASIEITQQNFVVLGIGYPTLVSSLGKAALRVQASGVRVAAILFEAGAATSVEAEPLLHWIGDAGVASDIFGRVAALQYLGCRVVRADVMMQADGDNLITDNTWLWVADHDDCSRKSDYCKSQTGLKVTGNNVVSYGLAVEHTHGSLVDWRGENGQVFFYQAELPYYDANINIVGYNVNSSVKQHSAHGVGVYIIKKSVHLEVHAAIRVPPSAEMTNMFSWVIGGDHHQFHHLVCTDAADRVCYTGTCSSSLCHLASLNRGW